MLARSILVVALVVGCSKKPAAESDESSSSGSGCDTTEAGQVAVCDNALAGSYPDGLAFSAFSTETDATTTAGQVAVETSLALLAVEQGCAPEAATSTNACVLMCQPGINPPNCYCPAGPNPPANCKTVCGGAITDNCVQLAAAPGPAPEGNVCQLGATEMVNKPAGAECFASWAQYKELNPPSGGEIESALRGTAMDKAPSLKIAESRERLKGVGDCYSPKLVDSLKLLADPRDDLDGTPADCYQPDWGINRGTQGTGDQEEACIVGFGREQIADTTAYIDFATGMVEAMLCQALKDGVAGALPDQGAEKDLLTSMVAALPATSGMSASKAKISRLTDQLGRAVYRTEINFKITVDPPDKPAATLPFELSLVHSPDGDFAYDGVLSIQHQVPTPPNAAGSCTTVFRAASVAYARSGTEAAPQLKFDFRSARFMGEADSYFDGDGLINFNVFDASHGGADVSGSNVDRMNYVTFDGDPLTGAGNLAYWVNFGQSYEEAARGFTFKVDAGADGTISGCGVAGAAYTGTSVTSIRKALYEVASMEALGNWRPFLCDKSEEAKVWKQCFTHEDGRWIVDAANTADDAAGFDFILGSENPILPPSVIIKPNHGGSLPPPPPPK